MIGKGFAVTVPKQIKKTDNRLVAEKLDEVADLLEHQQANLFRVAAYRDAAAYVAGLQKPIGDYLADGGPKALEALPTIGPSIAASIIEILQTGYLRLLDSLRGDADPEKLLQTVPQIGPGLAEKIHEQLGIETLEALEIAAHDGRLAALPGFGPRRVRGIQYALKDLLARRRPIYTANAQAAPPIAETLDVDREYRRRAASGSLPTITPKRFNPDAKPWLPILHTERGEWRFTALFSNTPRAHQLHRTHDWVVIQFERDHEGAGQCTVVTQHGGKLDGKRVIRGHEAACAEYYEYVQNAPCS
ncbi:helix-hairpin-helix domain-containing protein [Rhodobacteraceae bacterium KMM 6894]|nr:helix-hairpin-helix domain-containing protein [Rhodobacteraceae bacterium KMM 6894]